MAMEHAIESTAAPQETRAPAPSPGFVLPMASLCQRELVRFFRQKNRVVGALGTPFLFWLFLGSGFRESFQVPGAPPGTSYLQYAFPGTILMIVLFTSIFSAISIIEDKREGFLQGVLAAPVSRASVVAGKVLGGTLIAMIQALVFLALAPLLGLKLGAAAVAGIAGTLFLVALGMTALGFFFAWRTDSVQGFHAVMNLLLFPMWLLSGAFFPPDGAPVWLRAVMYANPLTYGLSLVRRCLYMEAPGGAAALAGPTVPVAAAVVVGFAVAAFYASVAVASGARSEASP
jgi:ABC-2 type transport system permease protein